MLQEYIFYAIPVLAIVFFAVSLCAFCTARHKNKKVPGTYSEKQIWVRTVLLIVSSVIFGALLLMVLGIAVLLTMAVAFM